EPTRGELAALLLDAHVRAGKERGCESDERGQRNQEHIEGVDEELPVEHEQRPIDEHAYRQRGGSEERDEARRDIDHRGSIALADRSEQCCADERSAGDRKDVAHWRPSLPRALPYTLTAS